MHSHKFAFLSLTEPECRVKRYFAHQSNGVNHNTALQAFYQ